MRTYSYFAVNEGDDDHGDCWCVYCRVTTHYVEGDGYTNEYQTSFATKAEADACINDLYEQH